MDKKAVLWPVIISVVIHMTLLAVAGIINLNDKVKPVDVLSVSIQDPEPEEKPPLPRNNSQNRNESPATPQGKQGGNVHDESWREDTIDLASLNVKYVHYLTRIKNKILRIWKYPQRSFEKNEEGDVVVKMSIDADGSLAGAMLLSSSGSADLDNGALSVVRDAAPYEPLPVSYKLSRLHIIASFNYKIMD